MIEMNQVRCTSPRVRAKASKRLKTGERDEWLSRASIARLVVKVLAAAFTWCITCVANFELMSASDTK